MNESQYNTVQNSTLPALQDDLILSVIEQLKTQVVNYTKINQDNKQVNELLTAELERNIERESALEKQALGFKNPCYLKKAEQLKPKLYDGRIIEKSDAVVIPDTEETLMLAEESHSKMIEKQNDPQMTEKKEKVLVIIALKEQLNKLKGKAVLTEAVSLSLIDLDLLKVDVAPLVPKLRKNRTARTDYIRHTQDEAATLREIIESVIMVSSASGSISQDNTKKNRIQRTQRKAKKNKSVVDSKATSSVINSVSNVNSDLKCASYNGCLFSDNHDACVVDYIKSVNASRKSKSVKTPVKKKVWKPTGNVFKTVAHKWKPLGRTFKLVGVVCPLTRIAIPIIVPPREPIQIVNNMDKPVVTLVYTRKPKAANKKVPNKLEPNNSWDPQVLMFLLHFLPAGCPNHPLIGNVTISRVYYVERLGHNLFSVGQFCDSDLEVAFRQHTCFICNLDGVDLLTGSQGNNLYTLSLQDMMASSPIFLLSKASKTKSWLWHRRLSHLNFGAINHLAKQGLVQEKRYLLHMDLCGPMRVENVNGKKYTLVIVENLGKLQPKADIGIFIGYAPTKKAFRIYNRRIRRIVETIHVDFDELTAMASEQSSLGPALNDMTPGTIRSGLV
nr:hypothetical protein [Tanacetum cinerariifolium]